jgi:hypothetical protein
MTSDVSAPGHKPRDSLCAASALLPPAIRSLARQLSYCYQELLRELSDPEKLPQSRRKTCAWFILHLLVSPALDTDSRTLSRSPRETRPCTPTWQASVQSLPRRKRCLHRREMMAASHPQGRKLRVQKALRDWARPSLQPNLARQLCARYPRRPSSRTRLLYRHRCLVAQNRSPRCPRPPSRHSLRR